MRLEGSVCAQDIGKLVALVADAIECRVVEHIGRADQLPVADLEPEAENPRGAVEPGAVCIGQADGHEGPVIPPGDDEGNGEGVQDLADRGEAALPPHDHDRVVLAHVLAGDQAEALGAG